MSDPIPNCVITLYFYEGNPATNTRSRFSYTCTHSAQGWQVGTDGSIYPPSRARTVQIRLSPFPINLTEVPKIAGFQMSFVNDFTGLPTWTPKAELKTMGIKMITPAPYPPKKETLEPLTFNFSKESVRVFYRLAVSINGRLSWDDPKIYDDGSE